MVLEFLFHPKPAYNFPKYDHGPWRCTKVSELGNYSINSDLLPRRTKISHDPNNTHWSRSSDGYGQRLLQSKGWTPGASLGARNKPYTKAKDASYIRVSMKDDNLGLGARSGVNVQATGLDAFQGLLGRLNGKQDDELEKEQKTRDDLRRAVYTENRLGALRFVSGGFLVGDRIKEVSGEEAAANIPQVISMKTLEKLDALLSETEPKTASVEPVLDNNRVKKKSKKRKHSTTENMPSEAPQHGVCDETTLHGDGKPDELRPESEESSDNIIEKTRRAEKAQRKLARNVRREEKRVRHSTKAAEKQPPQRTVLEAADHSEHASSIEPLAINGLPRQLPIGRHNVRSRYVQQKKLAMMDPKALNEVCSTLTKTT